jgi:prepilin-type N-terminal cleavage/methylation domain-containing protein
MIAPGNATNPRLLAERSKRAARARGRGFTLVELVIAMVAGLIVALSVVALSREASNTFHEESRIAAAEMQIRTAVDRLRADVARAGFMSTGNIFIDPNILTVPGTTTNVGNISAATYKSTTAMSLYSLAGIRLWQGGSAAAMPLSAYNNLNPDAIDIAGNMTGTEILSIGGVSGTGGGAIVNSAGCGGAGQRIYLDVLSTPAIWRLVGMSPTGVDATYTANLISAFNPIPGSSFIVRVVDNTTHKVQYAATCALTSATEPASWNATAGVPQPYIDLASNAITLAGISPNATINPVHIVRWQIGPSLINLPGDAGTGDATKYDLYRQYIDAKGNPAGNPEVIAEYAVDLKFAFTVDNLSDLTGNYTAAANSPIVVYAFEDSSNQTVADDATKSVSPYANGVEPQRIRSVRIRLVTRTAQQDRNEPLAVGGGAPNDYLYRYCLVANGTTCTTPGAAVFARTRTLINEVSLPNQARLWFR